MIKSIQLKNFQCHRDRTIEFGTGVNAIVGDSDVGKSALLRAFQWVAFNRPAADSLMTHGAKEMSVTVITDSHILSRFKSSTKNGYSLDGVEYLAIGRDVPEDISQALGLTEISFQRQFDSPFLLSESAGEVGRQLNELVDLTIIDRTTSNINRRVKDTNKTIKVLEVQSEKQKEELAQYKQLHKAATTLKEIQKEYGCFVGKSKQADAIEGVLKKAYPHGLIIKSLASSGPALTELYHIVDANKMIADLKQQQANLSTTLSRYDTYSKTIGSGAGLAPAMALRDAIAERAHNISMLFDEYNDLAGRVTALRRATKEAGKGIGAKDALRCVEILLGKYSELSGAGSAMKALGMMVNKIKAAQDHTVLVGIAVDEMKAEHKDLFGDSCPLCGAATVSSPVG